MHPKSYSTPSVPAAQPVSLQNMRNPKMSDGSSAKESITAKNILIIEDNPEMADLMAATFVFAGATAQIVTNGQEGLRTFFETKPDLILIDE